MEFHRRRILNLAAAAAALPIVPRPAAAQAYPSRTIHIVVGFSAGSSSDIVARIVGQWLSEHIGQTAIIENHTGAAGSIAGAEVARATPDGYTIFYLSSANTINATLDKHLTFDINRDFSPVCGSVNVPNVMEVPLSLPVKSVPEFIAYAKARPGQINMGSTGIGSTLQLAGELFKTMAGIDMVHVPFSSPPQALTELIAGRVQVMFDVMTQSIDHIRSGELRALAVTTATRSEALPDIPTVAEFLPGYAASSWSGFVVPKGTPADIIDKLNKAINAALTDPKVKARLIGLGCSPMTGTPAEFGNFITAEIKKWAEVIRVAKVTRE